jgi:hypothetical protein
VGLRREDVDYLVKVLHHDVVDLATVGFNQHVCVRESVSQYIPPDSEVATAKSKIQSRWEEEHTDGNNPVELVEAKGLTACEAKAKMIKQVEQYFQRNREVTRLEGVRVQRVPKTDCRKELVGQASCVATTDHEAYKPIGPHAGMLQYQQYNAREALQPAAREDSRRLEL